METSIIPAEKPARKSDQPTRRPGPPAIIFPVPDFEDLDSFTPLPISLN